MPPRPLGLVLLALACGGEEDGTHGGDDTQPADSGESAGPLQDSDGDGTPDSGDCSPGWASIGPNVAEIEGDGIDQNCDGLDRFVTDIRPFATQFWGESGEYAFGESMAIAEMGDTAVALIGDPTADGPGRIYVIGHPNDPMRRVMVQNEPNQIDDHLGCSMNGAVVDGHPTLVAFYYLDTYEQFLAGWTLDGPPGDLGPGELMFHLALTTEIRRGWGGTTYGPDLSADGQADLFWMEHRSADDILQVWHGPVTSTLLATPPIPTGLPAGVTQAHSIETVQSTSPTPDMVLIESVAELSRYVHFIEAGADGGRIDMLSSTFRPYLHGARPDMDGDGILERCVSDGFWVPDGRETGVVACFPPAAGGTLPLAEADTLLLGELYDSALGYSMAAIDLDGDGLDELVVGAPSVTVGNRAGLIYILKLVDGVLTIHATLSDFALRAGFGRFLGVGDLDGDGRPDIVTTANTACFDGASIQDPEASCPGAAWVIPGAAGLW